MKLFNIAVSLTFALPMIAQAEDGRLAVSWRNVKYMFCENQGRATFVDFTNSDLSTGVIQPSKMWVRRCNSEGPGSEVTFTTAQFTIRANGQYVIELEKSNSSTLNVEGSYQMRFPRGYSDADGNSGTCFLLGNPGTQNLSSYCE